MATKNIDIKSTISVDSKGFQKFSDQLKSIQVSLMGFSKALKSDKFDFSKSIKDAFLGKNNSGSTIISGMKSMIKEVTKSTISEIAKSTVLVTNQIKVEIEKSEKAIKDKTKKSNKRIGDAQLKSMKLNEFAQVVALTDSYKHRINLIDKYSKLTSQVKTKEFKMSLEGMKAHSRGMIKLEERIEKLLESKKKSAYNKRLKSLRARAKQRKADATRIYNNELADLTKQLTILAEKEKTLRKAQIDAREDTFKKRETSGYDFSNDLKKQMEAEQKMRNLDVIDNARANELKLNAEKRYTTIKNNSLKERIKNQVKNRYNNLKIAEKAYQAELKALEASNKAKEEALKKHRDFQIKILKSIKKYTLRTYKSSINTIKSFANVVNDSIKIVTRMFGKVWTVVKYLLGTLTALAVVVGILSQRFYKFGMTIISATEKMRSYNIGLLGMMKTQTGVNKLMKTALKITKDMPIAYDQVYQSTKAFALIGPVKQMLKDSTQTESVLKRMFKITLALSQIEPEWGMQGAIFSLREAMSGDLRSLQRRFEIPVNLIFGKDGRSIRDMKNDPKAMAEALERYMDTFFNDKTLKMSARQFGAIMSKIQGVFTKFYKSIGESGFYDMVVNDLQRLYEGLNKLSNSKAFTELTQKIGNMYASVYKSVKDIGSNTFSTISEMLFGKDDNTSSLDRTKSVLEFIAKTFRVIAKLSGNKEFKMAIFDSIMSKGKAVQKYLKIFIQSVKEVYSEIKSVITSIAKVLGKLNIADTDGILSKKGATKGMIYLWLFGAGNLSSLIRDSMSMVTNLVKVAFNSMALGIQTIMLGLTTSIGQNIASLMVPIGALTSAYYAIKSMAYNKTSGINSVEDKLESLISEKKRNKTSLSSYLSQTGEENSLKIYNKMGVKNSNQLYRLLMSNKDNSLDKFKNITTNQSYDDNYIHETSYQTNLRKNITDRFKNDGNLNVKIQDTNNSLLKLYDKRVKDIGNDWGQIIATSRDKLINVIDKTSDGATYIKDAVLNSDKIYDKLTNRLNTLINGKSSALKDNTKAIAEQTKSNYEYVKLNMSNDLKKNVEGMNGLTVETVKSLKQSQMFWDKLGYKMVVTSGYRTNSKDHNLHNTADFQLFNKNGSDLSKDDYNKVAPYIKQYLKLFNVDKMIQEFSKSGDFKNRIDSNLYESLGLNPRSVDNNGNPISRGSGRPVFHTRFKSPDSTIGKLWGMFKNTYNSEGETPAIKASVADKFADAITDLKLLTSGYASEQHTVLTNLNQLSKNKYLEFVKMAKNGSSAVIGKTVDEKINANANTDLQKLDEILALKEEALKLTSKSAIKNKSAVELLKEIDKLENLKIKIEETRQRELKHNKNATIALYKKSIDYKNWKYVKPDIVGNINKINQKRLLESIGQEVQDSMILTGKTGSNAETDEYAKAYTTIKNMLLEKSVSSLEEGIQKYTNQRMRGIEINNKQTGIVAKTNRMIKNVMGMSIPFINSNPVDNVSFNLDNLKLIDEKNMNKAKGKVKKTANLLNDTVDTINTIFDSVKAFEKFKLTQKTLQKKIKSFNFTNYKDYKNYESTVLKSGSRETKQAYYSQSQGMMEHGVVSASDAMQLAVRSIQNTRKNSIELARDFAIELNNNLETVFQSGFFDMLQHGFKNFGDFLHNIFNSIFGSIAQSLTKQLAQSATGMLMPMLIGGNGNSGLLGNLFGFGGNSSSGNNLFSLLSGSNGNNLITNTQVNGFSSGINGNNLMASALSLGGSGGGGLMSMALNSAGGLGTGLLAKGGTSSIMSLLLGSSVSKAITSKGLMAGINAGASHGALGASALKFIASPTGLATAGLGYLAFRKGGVFGSRVDHTGKAKSAYAGYNATLTDFNKRRMDDTERYLYSDANVSDFKFASPRYWNTHSGNGWTSKRTTTGHTDATAMYESFRKYMDLLFKSGKEHYAKQRELDKLSEKYQRRYIAEDIKYKNKYLSILKTKYEEYKKLNDFKGMDEYRDKILESEDGIIKANEDLKTAIQEHVYTVKDYNSWLSSNQGGNIAYQKTILDIQKERLQKLIIGEDSWYQAQKDYLDTSRTYTQSLSNIFKQNKQTVDNLKLQKINETNSRFSSRLNGWDKQIVNMHDPYISSYTTLLNKLRLGKYTNDDVSGITGFKTVTTNEINMGIRATPLLNNSNRNDTNFYKSVEIPIKSTEQMINDVTEMINYWNTIKNNRLQLNTNKYSMLDTLSSTSKNDYINTDYNNLLNKNNAIRNSDMDVKTREMQITQNQVALSNLAGGMSGNISGMLSTGIVDINNALVDSYRNAIENGTYLASDAITDIYKSIKDSFTKDQFTGNIQSIFKDDKNWDLFNTVIKDSSLQSDSIQNYLSDVVGQKKSLGINSGFDETGGFWQNTYTILKDENPYESWFNKKKKQLVTALDNAGANGGEGSTEWANALQDLFQFITDDAKRTKEKAKEASDALNETMDKIAETMQLRIAEERKSSKGDVIYVDINNRDSKSLLADLTKRIDTNDPHAQEAVEALKNRIVGL